MKRNGGEADGEEAFEALLNLHRRIDEAAAGLAARHAGRLRCTRGCSSCCLDELSVRPVEAERIRRRQASLLRDARPHAQGACAFLDGFGACRIYEDRPAVCRSQGLPLRLLFEDECGEIVEHRDICPLNLEGVPPLARLDEEDCWLIGPYELQLAAIDARFLAGASPAGLDEGGRDEGGDEDEEPRVALRSLFRRAPDGR